MVKKSIIRNPLRSTLYIRDLKTKTKCLFKVWCARRNVSMAYAVEKILESVIKNEKHIYTDLSNVGNVIDLQEFDEDYENTVNQGKEDVTPQGDEL